MFNSFFFKRNSACKLPGFLGNVSHTFQPDVEKITYISPDSLKLIRCVKPTKISEACGIAVDLPAALALLQSQKEKKIFDHIIKQATFQYGQPIIIFCAGSIVDNGLPYIKISPFISEPLQIGIVPMNYKERCNGYQLRYMH